MCCGKLLGTKPSPVLTITLYAEELFGLKITRSGAALPQMSKIVSLSLSCLSKQSKRKKKKKKTSIQHKALPNAEVNVLPQDNNVNVVAVVVVVCLLIA